MMEQALVSLLQSWLRDAFHKGQEYEELMNKGEFGMAQAILSLHIQTQKDLEQLLETDNDLNERKGEF